MAKRCFGSSKPYFSWFGIFCIGFSCSLSRSFQKKTFLGYKVCKSFFLELVCPRSTSISIFATCCDLVQHRGVCVCPAVFCCRRGKCAKCWDGIPCRAEAFLPRIWCKRPFAGQMGFRSCFFGVTNAAEM